MLENVRWLPTWRKDVDAATRFDELAIMARKHPEKFSHVVIGWANAPENKAIGYQTDYCLVGCNCDTMTFLGLLEMVRMEIHAVTRR